VSRASVRDIFKILKSNNSKIHRAVFPEHQLLQLPVRIDQLPREGEQAVNINTKVMKLKKVHLLSLCEDRSRQKNNPLQSLIAGDLFLLERHRKDN